MDPDIFPSLHSVTKQLRQQSLSLKNRLQSIVHDAKFVESLDLPVLVPNERCGLWYVPPQKRTDSAYFKSTDGHMNEWAFSFRRLNIHLLPLLQKTETIAIVDSTRRGKLMPDALLKTIPIWCAVISTIMAKRGFFELDNVLYTPRSMVSESEHNEIAKKINHFVLEAERLHLFDNVELDKPIVPCWIYPDNEGEGRFGGRFEGNFENQNSSSYRIQCVTASRKASGNSYATAVHDEKSISWNYVQGAADDHELWISNEVCEGKLNADLFWKILDKNKSQFIDSETGYLYDWLTDEEMVKRLDEAYFNMESDSLTSPISDITFIENDENDTGIALGVIKEPLLVQSLQKRFNQVIILSEKEVLADDKAVKVHHYKLQSSKKGSKQLRAILPLLMGLIDITNTNKVLIACDTGTDLGPGVALAILCKNFDSDWKQNCPRYIDKDTVRRHSAALAHVRRINPSRNTLQSINTYLMGTAGPA